MDLNSILQDLAAGRIDQAEAARRIDRLQAGGDPEREATPDQAADEALHQPAAEAPGAPQEASWGSIARDLLGAAGGLASSAAHTVEATMSQAREQQAGSAEDLGPSPLRPKGSLGVQRITVRATGRRVRIVGDSSVATLSADGPHVLRRNGEALEVASDGELGPSLDGFNLIRPPRSLDDLRVLGLGKELLLRVNPDILVDVEVTAGSLTTSNVSWLGKVRVTAGSAHLNQVVEVTDALVQAGSARVRGRLDRGRSRVRVESGNLVVELAADANVEVRAEAQLGRIQWPGGAGQLDSWVAGNGDARLDIGVVMGAATVRQDGVEAPDEHEQDQHEQGLGEAPEDIHIEDAEIVDEQEEQR